MHEPDEVSQFIMTKSDRLDCSLLIAFTLDEDWMPYPEAVWKYLLAALRGLFKLCDNVEEFKTELEGRTIRETLPRS